MQDVEGAWQGTGSGPIRLMFQDEARFGRMTAPRRCWAPFPLRPVCQAMISRQYVYAYAAASVNDGKLDTLVLPAANTTCMQIFLEEVASRYPSERIIMIADSAGWHTSASLKVPPNMVLMQLPPYSPELNPVEHLWDDLREKSFGNLIFESIYALERHLVKALKKFEAEVDRVQSIISWPWIINALFN